MVRRPPARALASCVDVGRVTVRLDPDGDEEVTVEPDRDGELCGMVGQSLKGMKLS